MTNPTPRYGEHITRSSWPLVLFLPDLALVLGVETPSAARRLVLREGIPHLRVGRRMAVRRQALLEWVAGREDSSGARPGPPPVPRAPNWTKDLLKGQRRSGGASRGRGQTSGGEE